MRIEQRTMVWAILITLTIPCIGFADELTVKLRSYIEGRLRQNPVMIREQELYKLSEANLMLKLADKVESGELNQETFDLVRRYLQSQ